MRANRETSRMSAVIGRLASVLILCTYALTGLAQTPPVGLDSNSASLQQVAGRFTLTGNMTTARKGHTATLLLDGRVLVVGGNSGSVASAELYDPLTGTFSATGSLSRALVSHRATLLQDGRTLITGESGNAELYNPVTGTFTVTGSMIAARANHTATLLLSGKVLVVGSSSVAELYDPLTGTFTPTGSTTDTSVAAAILLPDGRVLRTGLFATEIYDPDTGTFRVVGPAAIYDLVQDFTITLLASGSVLYTGGWNPFNCETIAFNGSVLYIPHDERFQPTAGMNVARAHHTATLMPGGAVLIAGGFSGGYGNFPDNRSTEIYLPDSGTFLPENSMVYERSGHTATLLKNGKVLIAGGGGFAAAQSSAELYDPEAPRTPMVSSGDAAINEGDAGTQLATIAVTLVPAPTAPVTLSYVTANGSAKAGSDYEALSGSVTFEAGEATKTISLLVMGDSIVEPNETFFVNFAVASGNAELADGQGIVTIINDDDRRLRISDENSREGSIRNLRVLFTVDLSPPSNATVTLGFGTADGSAKSGEDYKAHSGLLTFRPGDTAKTIVVEVIADREPENDEFFYVNLFNAAGAIIEDSQGVGTIRDDDR